MAQEDRGLLHNVSVGHFFLAQSGTDRPSSRPAPSSGKAANMKEGKLAKHKAQTFSNTKPRNISPFSTEFELELSVPRHLS